MKLEKVAARMSRDLGEAVFVGAFAVRCHIGPYRSTLDIDLAIASSITDSRLRELGYLVTEERGKHVTRTKDGIKVDIFTRDVSGISIADIFETSITKQVENEDLRIMALEALLIAKLRASRAQDIEDIRILCQRLKRTIRWNIIDRLAASTESSELRNIINALG